MSWATAGQPRTAVLFLAVAGTAYYASYLMRFPFGFGDEGYLYYVADALTRGQAPYRDIRLFSYLPGPFYLFGPLVRWGSDGVLVPRTAMALGLIAKTLVVFGCVRTLSGTGVALGTALVVLLVPGPWHKFYVGLLGVWCLWALLSHMERPGRGSAVHVGLALGVAAVVRIDIAISGAVLLVVVLAGRIWAGGRARRPVEPVEILAAPVTAATVTLPLLGLLASQGVLAAHLQQWLSFGGRIAERALGGAGRPPPSFQALWASGPEAGRAWVYYPALLCVLAFCVLAFAPRSARREERSVRRWQLRVVALWAVSGVPQFALERPDNAHLTQYACWFLLPAAILAGLVVRGAPTRAARRGVALAAGVLAALFVARYVCLGGGGTVGVTRYPVAQVTLSNGFSYPARRRAPLQPMIERIIEKSEPTDHIAALPFLPGIAFASRRRLHDRNIFLAPHSMTDETVETNYLRGLTSEPPRFVVYDPKFSFNTRPSGRLEAYAPRVDAHLRSDFTVDQRVGSKLLLEPRPTP